MIFTCAPENEKRDGVDYRDVKAWFQQCRDYKIDVDRQLERIHRIYGSATKITQNLSGMPTASGNGDKIGNAAVDIIEEQTRYREMVKRLTALQNEATKRAYCLVVATECANAIVVFYVNGKRRIRLPMKPGFPVLILSGSVLTGVAKLLQRSGQTSALYELYKLHRKAPFIL